MHCKWATAFVTGERLRAGTTTIYYLDSTLEYMIEYPFISRNAGAGATKVKPHAEDLPKNDICLEMSESPKQQTKQILERGDTMKPKHKTSLAKLHLAVKPGRG